ncbi:MAG: IS1380 family transposase [Candidatus Anammoximicrobium sp.]|nr:IS1380 family transposase [Candidatus Anammoximicrobium sp.]
MDHPTRQSVLFPDLFSKPVHVGFSREPLSSHGGVILLAARDRHLRLTETLAGCLRDRRQAAKVDHALLDQLRQRITSLAIGCPDGNDAAHLREDPMLKLACHRDPIHGPALASQPTLSRFENSVTGGQLLAMGSALAETVLAEQARRRQGRKLRRIVIDLDPTCDPTYGAQQLTLFNGYYDTYCYLPVIVTVSFGWERRKYPVAVVLRSGTAGPLVGTLSVLRRLLALLRKQFGEVPLYLRADSGFAVPAFFDFLEAEGLRYAVSMGSNRVLERLSQGLMHQVRRESAAAGRTITRYGEGVYRSGGWPRERALTYKAEVLVHPDKTDPRDNDRYLVHNLDYRYGPRGAFAFYYGHSDMENIIKELKHDLAVDRTSCSRFLANQFRLLLTLAAYVLLQSVAEATRDRDLFKAQMATLRRRLLTLAVRVSASVRRFCLQFTSHHPWADQWLACARSVGAIPT